MDGISKINNLWQWSWQCIDWDKQIMTLMLITFYEILSYDTFGNKAYMINYFCSQQIASDDQNSLS